jgi:hypothetical protein
MTDEWRIGKEALAIVEKIKPLLAGHPPVIQSAVLAELLSILLAGHWIPGDPAQTQQLRDSILTEHCALVRQLTVVNSTILGTAN